MQRYLYNTSANRQITDATVVSSDSLFIYRINPDLLKKQQNNKNTNNTEVPCFR